MNLPGRKLLAIYLIIIGSFQLVLYSLISLSEDLMVLFYFDPRFGLSFLETIIRGVETMPALLGWISAIVILVVGIFLLRYEGLLPLYFIVEFLFAAPSLFTFLVIGALNLSPSHGFSIGELLIPTIVFIFITVVPVVIGVRIYLSGRDVELLSYIPK